MKRHYRCVASLTTRLLSSKEDSHRTLAIHVDVEAHDMPQAYERFIAEHWIHDELPDEITIRRLPCKLSQEQSTLK